MTLTGVLVSSYVALWLVVAVQTLVLFELLRQIGILRRRVGPDPGALLTGDGLERGTLAPSFRAPDVRTGEMIDSEDLRGRPALLVFLSTGCQACRTLAPELRLFAREHADDAALLIVCADTRDNCVAFVREYKLHVPVLIDQDHRISSEYKARRTPSATLLDAEGRVRIHGIPNDLDQLVGLLQEEGTPMMDASWMQLNEEREVSHMR